MYIVMAWNYFKKIFANQVENSSQFNIIRSLIPLNFGLFSLDSDFVLSENLQKVKFQKNPFFQ